MSNPQVAMTLDDAVADVLGRLTGLDLSYVPEYDRYQAVTRQLNSALQAVALEKEWSYYSSVENIGVAHAGDQKFALRPSVLVSSRMTRFDWWTTTAWYVCGRRSSRVMHCTSTPMWAS